MTKINECNLLRLKSVLEPRGNLTFIEGDLDIPFQIKRIYYVYGVPRNGSRGGHAHRDLEQLMIALSGSFNIAVDDGKEKKVITLSSPSLGLYIPKMIWSEMSDFSDSAVFLVLASDHYNESEYIRNYDEFLKIKGA